MEIFQTHTYTFVLAVKQGACQPGSKNAFSAQILNLLIAIAQTELTRGMHARDVLT